jgi:hypothetical protein
MITNKKLQALIGVDEYAPIVAYFFNCAFNGWDLVLFTTYISTIKRYEAGMRHFHKNHNELLMELLDEL